MADGNVPAKRAPRRATATRRGCSWTDAEERVLRELWPDGARRTLCERLGRGWWGVSKHARALGLTGDDTNKSPVRWAGFITPHAAAEKAGVGRREFNTILAAYQAHFAALSQVERAELPSPSLSLRGRATQKRPHRMLDAQAALDAVEWWDALETSTHAATRHRIHMESLAAAVKRAGQSVPKHTRRSPQWWDDIVAMHGPKRRKVTR